MRVFFTNLGCKLNQAELERLAREFIAAGHQIAESLRTADLHVVNSCTVTHLAARDSRKAARRGHRLNPRLRTVLTGCFADATPEEAARLAGVDLVVPNAAKEVLVERVQSALCPPSSNRRLPGLSVGKFGHARALVKIEDGCDMRCAFCIIPLTRGRQRSRPADAVVDEVRDLVTRGFQEIVVTGVQISSYRCGELGLYDLLRRLLDETGIARLRLTSIAPWAFDPRLLELAGTGRLCRHFHLSLQSGCSDTLARMRRPYTTEQFASLAERIRTAVPGVALTTDIIVGFPGESDREFIDSLAFCRAMRFARIHPFPFSPRPGTAAAEMRDRIGPGTRRERMQEMLRLAANARRSFWRQHLGEEAEVLWESNRGGRWRGTTDHYIRVVADGETPVARRLGRVWLHRITDAGVLGRLDSPAFVAPSGSAA